MPLIRTTDSEQTGRSLAFLADVPLECSVEFGRASISIRRFLSLAKGSIIELDRAASAASVDILANGKRVASGEVVIVNRNFGVRVTEIADPDGK